MTYSDILNAIYDNYSDACTVIEKPNIIVIELEDAFTIKVGLKHIEDNQLTIDKNVYGKDEYKTTANSYKVDTIDDVVEIIDNEIDKAVPELFVS